MRKLFALLFVAAAFTFVACDKKSETAGAVDSVATDSVAVDPAPQAPMEAPADSAAMEAPADSAATPAAE